MVPVTGMMVHTESGYTIERTYCRSATWNEHRQHLHVFAVRIINCEQLLVKGRTDPLRSKRCLSLPRFSLRAQLVGDSVPEGLVPGSQGIPTWKTFRASLIERQNLHRLRTDQKPFCGPAGRVNARLQAALDPRGPM